MACEQVITNVPPAGQAKPANPHQGGGFVRWESCGSWKMWTEDVNANCHGIYGLRSINCIPLIDFLTTPLQVDVDANGHIIYNVGKIFIGSSTDDGSGALLQVAGEINAQSYMVDGVEFAASSVSPAGMIDLYNINNIDNHPLSDFLPAGPNGSIQFNENGKFAGDAFLVYDELTHRVGIKPAGLGPQWTLDVGGDVNIIDPTYLGYAYRINGIPFAVADPSGSHINLINIGLINGAPPGSGGGGGASPGGVQGNVQFNSGGLFAGSNNLFWDNTNNRLGIGTAAPQYPLDVVGNENISGCYFIAHVPFACADGSGISLQNITTINGGPIGGSGGTPAAPNTSVQFNNNGAFGGSPNLTWNNAAVRLGIGVPPQFNLDVAGIVNATQCYYVASTPFACSNGSGGVNLTNITNINGGPPGGASVTVSDTPPANPATGNLWFDSTDTQLYIWYTDPTSSQWVPTINQCGLIGDAPSDGQVYGRSDGAWVVAGAGGGSGQNQTPWLSDIQASGFQLLGASTVSFLFGSTSGSIFASGAGSLQFIGNGNTPLWVRSPSWLQLDSVNTVFTSTTSASQPAFQFSTSGQVNALDIISPNGLVGIGTINPVSLLHVSGLAIGFNAALTLESTGSDFIQYIRGTQIWWEGIGLLSSPTNWTLLYQPTNIPVISATTLGYVGIGTQAPLGEFTVVSTNVANPNRGITSAQFSNNALGAVISLEKARGTVAVPAAIQVGDYLAGISFGGWVSNGNFTSPVALQILSTGVTAATITADLLFATSIGEAMRLTSAGLLGIGTPSPSAPLTVNGNVAGLIRYPFINSNTSASSRCDILVQADYNGISTGTLVMGVGNNAYGQGEGAYIDSSTHSLYINTPLAIFPNNVGIGTASNTYALEVFKASGNCTISIESPGAAGADAAILRLHRGSADWFVANSVDGSVNFQIWNAQTGFYAFTATSGGSIGMGSSIPPAGVLLWLHARANQNIAFTGNLILPNSVGIQALNDANNAYIPLEIRGNPIVLGNGNVGIGTNAPAAPLDVNGLAACTYLGGQAATSYNACVVVQGDRGLSGPPPNNTMTWTFQTASKTLSFFLTDQNGTLHTASIVMS